MSGESNKKKGTDYELFVQSVYNDIIHAEGIETIDVKHDITIAGNSGCEHQIDVYWEFKLAGETYKTAIECKAFAQNVPVGKIRDFYGVLLDIPNLKGIFATKKSYQSGAKKYAKHYGITLKELREPTKIDWQDRVKTIRLNFHIIMPEIIEFKPRFLPSFQNGIPDGEEKRFELRISTHEPIIFDSAGKPVVSYEELRQMLPSGKEPLKDQSHFVPFPDHFLLIGEEKIEIEGIDLVYDVNVETEEIAVKGSELIRAIVKDVENNEFTVVDKKGEVSKTQ